MFTLHELGIASNTDKAITHNFCNFYENYIAHFRELPIFLLEIGIWHGESLRMWSDYFKNGKIFAIDVNPEFLINENRILSAVANQSKRQDLINIFPNQKFHIIVDDGGHKMDQQQISLGCLIDRLLPGGFYLLEDLHTSNLEGYRDFKSYETSTLAGLRRFQQTRIFDFPYLTAYENFNLQNQIENIDIFIHNDSITSVLCKK